MYRFIGRLAYVLLYPLLAIYLNYGERTRLIIVNNNQVLLIRTWIDSGKWEAPGGGLHKNEDPIEGVAREVKEELGLSIAASLITKINKEKHISKLFRYNVYYFEASLLERPASFSLQKIEVAEARWFGREDIGDLPMQPRLKEIVSKVLQ